jgi:cystathionine beta-lyase/cystathionine gamma-synthase
VIYEFASAAEFAAVMADSERGYLYSRLRNPSTDELAAAVAELEGAQAAHCYASGIAAVAGAVALLAPGEARVVAAAQLYGQSYSLLRARGTTVFCDVRDHAAIEAALPGAALLYVETLANPHLALADVAALARLAHAAGARLVVDNTVATPLALRPLEHGADLVVHSATKFLNGHSDVLAGVAAGPAELVRELVRRSWEDGATLAPDAAWLVRRGLKTLHLRLERASQNALAVARFLEGHEAVERVSYPGLASHPDHELARRTLGCFGALLAFELRGGRAAGERVMDRVELCLRATSLGGVDTVISHPASTSHRQLSAGELAAAGISEGFLRLSVGCEDVRDIVADLEQALT